MKSIVFLIFVLFTINVNVLNSQNFTSGTFKGYYNKINNQNYKQKLLLFENFLIESKQLKNHSEISMYNFFRGLANGEKLVISDFINNKDQILTYLAALSYNKNKHKKKNSLNQLRTNPSDIRIERNLSNQSISFTVKKFAKAFMQNKTKEDFLNKDVKTFGFFALIAIHLKLEELIGFTNEYCIHVKITNDEQIFINSKKIELNKVSDEINKILKAYPENMHQYFKLNLKIAKEVKMGIVVDFKQEIRKCKVLKINYSVL